MRKTSLSKSSANIKLNKSEKHIHGEKEEKSKRDLLAWLAKYIIKVYIKRHYGVFARTFFNDIHLDGLKDSRDRTTVRITHY